MLDYPLSMSRLNLTKEQRRRIWDSNNRTCVYCDRPLEYEELCIDHFFPHCEVQSNAMHNLVASCRACNGIKREFPFDNLRDARNYIRGAQRLLPDCVTGGKPIEAPEPQKVEKKPTILDKLFGDRP
jgi:5-methylcytosine-specific restriction endonuclease McrA